MRPPIGRTAKKYRQDSGEKFIVGANQIVKVRIARTWLEYSAAQQGEHKIVC